MMEPLNLQEFAENLRLHGNSREVEFADEILMLIDLEDDVAEPYAELCDDIVHRAPDNLKDKPTKALERLIDRTDMLDEIEKLLTDDGREPQYPDDAVSIVKELLGILNDAEKILEDHGWASGDFLDGLAKLAENVPTPMEYDL